MKFNQAVNVAKTCRPAVDPFGSLADLLRKLEAGYEKYGYDIRRPSKLRIEMTGKTVRFLFGDRVV